MITVERLHATARTHGLDLRPGQWHSNANAAWASAARLPEHLITVAGIRDVAHHHSFVVHDERGEGTLDALLFGGDVIAIDSSRGRVTRLRQLVDAQRYHDWRSTAAAHVSQPSFTIDSENRFVTDALVDGRRLVTPNVRRQVTQVILEHVVLWKQTQIDRSPNINFADSPLYKWFENHSERMPPAIREEISFSATTQTVVAHGDLSPWNIIVGSEPTEYSIIDWTESELTLLPWWYDIATVAFTSGCGDLLSAPEVLEGQQNVDALRERWAAVAALFLSAADPRMAPEDRHEWALGYAYGKMDVA